MNEKIKIRLTQKISFHPRPNINPIEGVFGVRCPKVRSPESRTRISSFIGAYLNVLESLKSSMDESTGNYELVLDQMEIELECGVTGYVDDQILVGI